MAFIDGIPVAQASGRPISRQAPEKLA